MSLDTRINSNTSSTATSTTDATPTVANPPRRYPLSWVVDIADLVVAILRPISIPLLRIALGVVYVWFGILKIIGASPVADLVASMLPFVPAQTAVIGMGIVEVILGAAFILGLLVPWVAAAMVLHLIGTLAVFVFHPATAFSGNPFLVTLEGEFIAKNLVLIAGLLVVAGHSRVRRAG